MTQGYYIIKERRVFISNLFLITWDSFALFSAPTLQVLHFDDDKIDSLIKNISNVNCSYIKRLTSLIIYDNILSSFKIIEIEKRVNMELVKASDLRKIFIKWSHRNFI